MKIVNIIYIILASTLLSCLPQEKTTQCGSNEAYDSSRRKCVATLSTSDGTVNISNVTPSTSYTVSSTDASKTHTVTISDPYDNGYQVKWMVTYPNGNSILAGTGLSLTFSHTAYSTGVYILEVQLLSAAGTEVYDSRSWTVNIIDEETPSISAVTPTPLTTALTSAATVVTANISNPDAIADIDYEWYVNGVLTTSTGTFSTTTETLTFSFDPDGTYTSGPGIYNIQLLLKEDGTGSTYTSFNWVTTVSIPSFAEISTGSSATFSTASPIDGAIVEVIADMAISAGGFLADTDGDGSNDTIDFCVETDDAAGVDSDGVWVDFLIDGAIIPGASNIQLASAGTSYCLESYNDYDYTLPSNIVAESHTITASVYDKYTGNTSNTKYKGYNLIKDLTWTIRVRQQNTPPTIEINESTTGALSKITDCSKTTTAHTNCEVTQGTPFRVGIEVKDDDYDPEDYTSEYANFRVDFLLNGISLDGSSNDISDTDCYEDFSETAASTRYYCDITINPYDSNGPIDVSGLSYTITAVVTDQGSPYTSTTKDSNTVTWKISSVLPTNTSPSIETFAADSGAQTADSSYIALPVSPTVALDRDASGIVKETDAIEFVVSVNDAERDDHVIKVKRCLNNDSGCSATDKDIATVVVNSTDNSQVKQTTINHTITEDAVTGIGENTVYFKILVTDSDGLTGSSIVGLLVANYNPDPVFDPDNFLPDVNVTTYTAFAGFPMTFETNIDSGDDASVMDGTTPTFQWMYKLDGSGTWTKIEGATENKLIWIPDASIGFGNPAGELVNIKVCVGDDGYESGAAGDSNKDPYLASDTTTDCATGAQSQASGKEWHVTVFSNMMQGGAFADNSLTYQSNGEIASWIDPSSTNPIIKYVAYETINSLIVIEKIVLYDDGSAINLAGSAEIGTEEISSISFAASTDASYASYDINHLSITGDTTNGKLYIAYMTYFSGSDSVHIRKIDISGGKLALTHDGKFSWDTEYESDLGNYIVPSTSYGMDVLTTSTDNEPILTFTSAAMTGMSVQFNTINNATVTFTAGSDFCSPLSSCTTTDATATNFADAINNYNSTNGGGIQGLTATASSNTVTLSGIKLQEYIQEDIDADKIGQIMVHQTNGSWVLPFINNGLADPDKNKISLYTGSLTTTLGLDTPVTYELGTVASVDLANDISEGDRVIIATRSNSTGLIGLYELNASYSIVDADTDIFSGENTLTNIKVAVSKEPSGGDFEPSAFVTAINTDNRFAFARVDSSGGNFDFTTLVASSDLDNGFDMGTTAINNYDITAGAKEYQLLLAAVIDPTSGTDYKTYLFNITGSTPAIDCSHNPTYPQNWDYCTIINHTGDPSDNVLDAPIALTDVIKDVTLSTGGATAGENQRDIISIVHHIDDGSARMLPTMGILNITGDSPSTLATPSGNAGDATDPGYGVYMNPFVFE